MKIRSHLDSCKWKSLDNTTMPIMSSAWRANQRLRRIIGREMHRAHTLHQSTGKAARIFAQFPYQTHKSWSCSRRVVAKAEYLDKGENPRFLVTSLSEKPWTAQDLYEEFYCARGEMENRIKEQMHLFADRLSTGEMKGNQLRLYFSALAWRPGGSAPPAGPEGYRMGPGTGRYHPLQAVQNRRHCEGDCTTHPAPDEFSLSLERHLRPSLPGPALLIPSKTPTTASSPARNSSPGGALQKISAWTPD
jgi:Transposase DDE domain group 1